MTDTQHTKHVTTKYTTQETSVGNLLTQPRALFDQAPNMDNPRLCDRGIEEHLPHEWVIITARPEVDAIMPDTRHYHKTTYWCDSTQAVYHIDPVVTNDLRDFPEDLSAILQKEIRRSYMVEPRLLAARIDQLIKWWHRGKVEN